MKNCKLLILFCCCLKTCVSLSSRYVVISQKQVGTQVQSSEKQTVQLSNEIRSLQNEIKEKEASNQELQVRMLHS